MDKKAKIVSIGTYIPNNREQNYDKVIKFGYDESFLIKKLGFIEIAKKDEDDTTLNMCLKAYQNLKYQIEHKLDDIQIVTVVTQNPTINIPHTSAMIHNVLNLSEKCMTFDISQGCAGYVHAVQIMMPLMDSLKMNNGLIFTCDSYNEIIDPEDKNVCMIFGDGATASLISRECKEGYILKDSEFGTAGNSNNSLIINEGKLHMNGWKIFQHAKNNVPKSVNIILNRNGIREDEIDLFILHQGSKHIVESLRKEMKLSNEQTEFNSGHIGNTISSSVPLQLSNHFGNSCKSKIILCGFGVGVTWGTCLLEYL